MSLPVLLAVTDPRYEEGLLDALEHRDLGVTVVRRCVDVADLLATAAAGTARAAVLSGDLRRLDRDALARLAVAGLAVVGVVPQRDDAAADRLRSLGVFHLLPVGSDAQLVSQTVHEAVAASPGVAPVGLAPGAATGPEPVAPADVVPDTAAPDTLAARPGLVAVWGPTGAPGRTTVAVNLAAELADLGVGTALVDADTYGGSIAMHLGLLDESAGVSAACRSAEEGALTAELLAGHCRQLAPRLRVLTGLTRADRWPELRPAAYQAVLGGLRELAPAVVVDCGFCLEQDEELGYDGPVARRNGATLATLAAADVVVAVGGADPVSLVRLVRGVGQLTDWLPDASVRVVANRVRGLVQPGNAFTEVTEVLPGHTGRRPAALVPDDPAALRRGAAGGPAAPVPSRRAPRPGARCAVSPSRWSRPRGSGGGGAGRSACGNSLWTWLVNLPIVRRNRCATRGGHMTERDVSRRTLIQGAAAAGVLLSAAPLLKGERLAHASVWPPSLADLVFDQNRSRHQLAARERPAPQLAARRAAT